MKYDITPNNVWYDFSLSPNGAIFTIYKRSCNDDSEIKKAKDYLIEARDVVGRINVFDIDNNGNIK